MEHKFLDRSKSLLDLTYHEFREAADHINQNYHRDRLLFSKKMILDLKDNIKNVCDLGCGNGGLLKKLGFEDYIGFDITPANIQYGRTHYNLSNIFLFNFINEINIYENKYDHLKFNEKIPKKDLYIMTETLEHLEDPHAMLEKVSKLCKYAHFSVPANESIQNSYELHIWVWDNNGFSNMVQQHYTILDHKEFSGTQYINCISKKYYEL
jgi:2-polyprenyl-3-methyl-5-hydroxy-6-metoxy-1,4-benzoquinol methylase